MKKTKIKKDKSSSKTKKMPKVIIAIAIFIIILIGIYIIGTSPVGKNEEIKPFTVSEGDTYSTLGEKLKDQGFIKNEIFYKIYIKIIHPQNLYAGKYPLSESMSLTEIVKIIASGNTYIPDAVLVTFKEGKNIPNIAKVIEEKTNHTAKEVLAVMEDEEYIDSLIEEYWFITEEIKNKDIYYPLEGYLFPETYMLDGKDMPIKDIFNMMLKQTDSVLSQYKSEIEDSNFTVHQFLTLASIIELEASNSDDRNGVAGVFYNRLNDGWSLGSDVTTYYGAKVDMSERDLYKSEINAFNGYNTRNSKMAGKLPIGPICNPSKQSIEAVIHPTKHEYYYFVADKNKKTYFNKDYSGHESTINKLKKEGLWYEYE